MKDKIPNTPKQASKPADGESVLNDGLAMRNKKLHEYLSRAVILLCEEPDPTEYVDFMDTVQDVLAENILAMDDATVISLDC